MPNRFRSPIPSSLLELLARKSSTSIEDGSQGPAADCLARPFIDCREFEHCARCTPVEQCLRVAQGLAGHPLMGDY